MSRFSYSVLNFVQELENAASCNSLDTSDTGSYGVFADYLEQSQTSGVVDMSTAAELNGNALCLNNSYDIAVLFAEQSHCAKLLSLFNGHLGHGNGDSVKYILIYDSFDLGKLLGCNCLKVGEVETTSLSVNIRTCLMNMVAQNLSQSCLEQMSCGVVSHDSVTLFNVNGSGNTVALAETAHFNCTEVEVLTLCGLLGIGNCKAALTDGDNACVAYLSAALSVERSFIEDNNCVIALVELANFCAVLEYGKNLCIYFKLRIIIACELSLGEVKIAHCVLVP